MSLPDLFPRLPTIGLVSDLFPRPPTIGLVKFSSDLLGHQLLHLSWCLLWHQAVLPLLPWRRVVHLLLLLLLTLHPFGEFIVSYLYSFFEDGFAHY